MEEGDDDTVVAPAPTAPALYLVPYNSAAKQAVAEPYNAYLRCLMPNNTHALYIHFADPDKQAWTLGRAGTDIYLPDTRAADISKHQCSFTNISERGAVLLEDVSSRKNTEPYASNNGGQAIGYGKERRCVLVARGINNMIGIGKDRFYQFEIHWNSDGLFDFLYKEESYRTGPRKSRQKRYIEGEEVGSGSYGSVWWVMDVHTAQLMAVKRFHNMQGKHLTFATREVENLFRINRTQAIHHNHILEILDSAGGGKNDDWGEIFMPLKAGNLKTLVLDPSRTVSTDDLADIVLHQMLLALACIAEHKIVHRDLKPENVLWEYDPDGNYHFRLGDFGLSNNPELAVTVAGTEPFMAPEVFHRQKQTEKVDIWSLFATIVWVKNIGSFRQSCARYSAPAIHNWLVQIAGMEQFCNIRRMASVRAKDRPSARQLLRIISGGGGAGGETDELADSLQNALTLDPTGSEEEDDDGQQPTARIKRPAGAAAAADEQGVPVPYYEPYPPSPENYAWEPEDGSDNNGEGGGSTTGNKVYAPPQMGQSPRAGGGGAGPLAEAWVKTYEDNPYGPPDEGDPDSGTAVPDIWTARQLPTQEMNELVAAQATVPRGETRERRVGKGKKKKGA